MKKLMVVVLMVLISSQANASWNGCRLSESQRSVLEFSYSYGSEFGIGMTLAAIAMQESRLGDVNVNIQDPSASPFHITLDKYLRYRGWPDTNYNRNRAAHNLITDIYSGAHLATEEVLYWYNRHSNVSGHERWRRTWASYNAGNRWNGSQGQTYATSITNNIRHIRECGWINY